MTSVQLNDTFAAPQALYAPSQAQWPPTLMGDLEPAEDSCKAWGMMIDLLLHWSSDPRAAVDDDYEPPTRLAIAGALKAAARLREVSCESATRMAPTGDGGIVFEWRRTPRFDELEIGADGRVEIWSYRNGKLAHRQVLVPARSELEAGAE